VEKVKYMKRILLGFSVLLTIAIVGCSSSGNLVKEEELGRMTPKKVMELGAERYSNYDYDAATYYYLAVTKIFTNDNEEYNEARAWANYELGYIKYKQQKYDEALKQFDEVLKFRLVNNAPLVLATKMKEKLKSVKK